MSEEFQQARQQARQAFTKLLAGAESSIDLGRAALLIAAEEYPEMDLDAYMRTLEELALQVHQHLERTGEPTDWTPTTPSECFDVLRALNSVLFEQEHFRGNRLDYYNPQNSFLNRVLERRLGIPLTLSLLYMEVGKRLGLTMEGVGMPFHFIVRCSCQGIITYVDPYEKGKFLSEQDCRKRLAQIFKEQKDFDPQWLEPLGARQILVRLLTNLKHIYLHQNDFQRALTACDRILLIEPVQPVELRDRGVIHFQLHYYARALRDLNAYLDREPEADDKKEVQQQIKVIRQMLAMMN